MVCFDSPLPLSSFWNLFHGFRGVLSFGVETSLHTPEASQKKHADCEDILFEIEPSPCQPELDAKLPEVTPRVPCEPELSGILDGSSLPNSDSSQRIQGLIIQFSARCRSQSSQRAFQTTISQLSHINCSQRHGNRATCPNGIRSSFHRVHTGQ